jgi:hypothetical protein
MPKFRVSYMQDGELVDGGVVEFPDTPWWREMACAEWELIKRYDRGEFDE